jgi:hypothetical protein
MALVPPAPLVPELASVELVVAGPVGDASFVGNASS